MKNVIDQQQILKVYELIQQHGEEGEHGKTWRGITVSSDFDGYTLYFQGQGVFLTYGFHNTYHLEYDTERNKEVFFNQLKQIEQDH